MRIVTGRTGHPGRRGVAPENVRRAAREPGVFRLAVPFDAS
ncbi:protein of unknown function [Blastococcus saxobsidens DD2]|uniref:Uncharacterized protein n=1 Tax=Blastococcus saxobsidens (strain DD2) TaxID=1146883 RepID=H6RKX4_BLASD|nr:protein of unknown function [Blastococcus saxobsidens DD2]